MGSLAISMPTIDNYTIESNFDANILKVMLKDDTISHEDRKLLKNINKHKKNHNTIVDTYTWTNENKYGRMYCNSLQMLPKEFRNGLLNNSCFELDIKNCHYTILEQIGKKFNLSTKHIEYYNLNREECLERLDDNREKAKEMYLSAGYGANIEKLKDISNECKNIFLRLKDEDNMKDLYCYAEKNYKKKKNNYKSTLHSFGAYTLQTCENRIILSMLDFFKQKNEDELDKIKVQIILHDGLIISNNNIFTNELLKEIEDFVEEETEWTIKLDKKQCPNKYEAPKKDYILIQDDEDACNYLKKHYGNKIVHSSDDWYCHLPNTNHWSKGINFIRAMIKDIDFRIAGEKNDKPYSSTTGGMNKIIEYLERNCGLLYPIDKNFINNVNKNTEGLTFYTDKYYNWKTKTFHQIQNDNLPIVYEDYIAPDFSDITDEECEEYCDTHLTMFKKDELPFILRFLGRALAGHVGDKVWYSFGGWRNTGKGRIQKICSLSFGSYITTVDAPIMKTTNKQDASERRWVLTLNCHIKRLAFSNEVKSVNNIDCILDGGDIKKVYASGGDDITTREHHGNEMIVKNNCISIFSLNGNPITSPLDALNNCIAYEMPYKFVEFPQDISERKKIEYIPADDVIYKERNKRIFTKIIFDAYGEQYTIKDFPERMQTYMNDIIGVNLNEPIMIFRNKIRKPTEEEIKNRDDWTSFCDIKDLFKPAKITDTKLGRFLRERGFKSCYKSITKKNDTLVYKLKIVDTTTIKADVIDEEDE
jgi:hypothetical protein